MEESGQLDGAIAEFRKALEIDPSDADAHNNLAVALVNANRPEEAIPHFERALILNPNSRDYRYNLARVLLNQGQVSEAISQLEKVSSPPDPAVLATLAAAYAKAGRFSDALPVAKEALGLASQQGKRDLAARLEHMIASFPDTTAPGTARANP
jgi:Flp pilus assembly protein TadD